MTTSHIMKTRYLDPTQPTIQTLDILVESQNIPPEGTEEIIISPLRVFRLDEILPPLEEATFFSIQVKTRTTPRSIGLHKYLDEDYGEHEASEYSAEKLKKRGIIFKPIEMMQEIVLSVKNNTEQPRKFSALIVGRSVL